MKPTEKFATVISLAALALSSVNTYHQFLSVRHSLVLSSNDLMPREGAYHAELTVSNIGNRPVAIANIHFCVMGEEAVAFETAGSRGYVETYVDNVRSEIVLGQPPSVFDPGEMRVFRLKSEFDFSESPTRHNKSFNIGICLTANTSEAHRDSVGLMPFWMRFDENGKPGYPQRGRGFEMEGRKKIEIHDGEWLTTREGGGVE